MRRPTRITLALSAAVALSLTAPASLAAPAPAPAPAPANHTSKPSRATAVNVTTPATPPTRTAPPAPAPTSRADLDGDGRPDRTTLTTVRTTARAHTFRLTTRTATGRTISTLITIPANLDDTTTKDVWWGAAPIDGVPGAEVVLDRMAGVGDFPDCAVYTIRKGTFRVLRAPGAKSDRTDWSVSNHPTQVSGYAFSTSRGVRRVVATRLTKTGGTWDAPVYSGFRTTYRWARTGWIRTGSERLRNVSDQRAQTFAGWVGITLR